MNNEKNPSIPLPIFLDLSVYTPSLEGNLYASGQSQIPNLGKVIDEILLKNAGATTQVINHKDILKAVQEEGALLIFDGLDEKLVHMGESQQKAFIQAFWQALPIQLFHQKKA